jgi:outer membrane protein TolC
MGVRRRFLLVISLPGVFFLGSCLRYEEKPLNRAAVDRQLAPPSPQELRVAAEKLKHPMLVPLAIDLERGLTPEEAGVVAVIVNPELRGERDRRGVAAAQVLQAGLLPNPQLAASLDYPYEQRAPDDFTAYSLGVDWDITTALIGREQRRRAAAAGTASVELDVAWKEWQVAQEATLAAYDVLALDAQARAAHEADRQLGENLALVRRAVERHEKTVLDLSAAEASALDARAAAIAAEKDATHQRLALGRALGFPPDRPVKLRATDEMLPARLDPPPAADLLDGLDDRRLDLLALKRGYESQDATLRAAILAQFPKLTLGVNGARDTSDVRTIGIGATLELPLFDRNQGVIATESATRQKLFDEYAARVFAARADIASVIADIAATNLQVRATEEAIPGLERLEQTYRAALAQGNVDVVGLYAIVGNLWQKRIDLIKLKQQLAQNWIALELASGQHLPMQPAAPAAPARPAPATVPSTQGAQP